MTQIIIKKLSLHQVDVLKNKVDIIKVDIQKDTIIKFTNNLIEEILISPNKREFKFKEGNTEIKNSIPEIINNSDNIDNVLFNNAKRLLEKQIIADRKIQHLDAEVQKGSLLHIHFVENNKDKLLICKVEHDEIINEINLEINRGLNTGKKIYKAFLKEIENTQVFVSDKNNSKYWWREFLELEQVYSDEENTSKSVDKIINSITSTSRKKEYKLDSTILRNNVIGYFRTNENFNLTDLKDSVFENYTPYNKNFPITKINEKISALSRDDSFDKQFSIISDKIGKRKQNKIKIGPGLSLSIEDYVNNLDKLIIPYSVNDKYGMVILTEEAYNFAKQKSSNGENN